MNDYIYYIVPGILAFFVVWVFFRFMVKKDIERDHVFFYMLLSLVLIVLLVYGWYFKFKLF